MCLIHMFSSQAVVIVPTTCYVIILREFGETHSTVCKNFENSPSLMYMLQKKKQQKNNFHTLAVN